MLVLLNISKVHRRSQRTRKGNMLNHPFSVKNKLSHSSVSEFKESIFCEFFYKGLCGTDNYLFNSLLKDSILGEIFINLCKLRT